MADSTQLLPLSHFLSACYTPLTHTLLHTPFAHYLLHLSHSPCYTTPLSHISSSLGDVIRHERVCLNCAIIQGRGVTSRRGYGKPSLTLRCDSSCLYQETPSWISLMNICSYKTQTLPPTPPYLLPSTLY